MYLVVKMKIKCNICPLDGAAVVKESRRIEGSGKLSHSWFGGGGGVTVTRGHGTETHGNNEAVINRCAYNSNNDLAMSCVINCRMYVSVDNLLMLQRKVKFVGTVLNRAVLSRNRSGYNVSFDLVRAIAETMALTVGRRCVRCQYVVSYTRVESVYKCP
jgi:hypothetical protein